MRQENVQAGLCPKNLQRSRAAAKSYYSVKLIRSPYGQWRDLASFRTVAKQSLQDRHHKAATALVGTLPIFMVLLLSGGLLPSPLLVLLLGRVLWLSCSSCSIRASRRLVRGLLPPVRLVRLLGGTQPWHLLADRSRLIRLSAILPRDLLEHLRGARASQHVVLLQKAVPAQ